MIKSSLFQVKASAARQNGHTPANFDPNVYHHMYSLGLDKFAMYDISLTSVIFYCWAIGIHVTIIIKNAEICNDMHGARFINLCAIEHCAFNSVLCGFRKFIEHENIMDHDHYDMGTWNWMIILRTKKIHVLME